MRALLNLEPNQTNTDPNRNEALGFKVGFHYHHDITVPQLEHCSRGAKFLSGGPKIAGYILLMSLRSLRLRYITGCGSAI